MGGLSGGLVSVGSRVKPYIRSASFVGLLHVKSKAKVLRLVGAVRNDSTIKRGPGWPSVRLLFRSLLLVSVRRCALLLHLYWTFLNKHRNPSAASESLRLVWNAVPDSFITCNEIAAEFVCLGSEKIADLYDFYCKAVGEYPEDVRPRTLKHLCRSTIRYQLWRSEQWLPEGIERIGLPTRLQSYLKLEM
ncbi:hypothetical protein AVEN_24326-1 [Araneus ventricosus]|uniref:SOCS box domain-containing protein n=1 Tax=Araneus ventricosus TaxID=182803 RepID=A0A4Y2NL18_ARAVE|nr:hypothetical protein AVEN_24326-1 [Araneus ventricosus]